MNSMTDYVTASGYVGTALFSCMYVPQIYLMYTGGGGNDISTCMLCVAMTGSLFSLVYGVGIGSLPVMMNNVCSLTSVSIIMYLKRSESRDRQ